MIHAARPRQALMHLAEVDPALAALSLWCTHRDDDGPTRTEGSVIRYGPGFDLLPIEQQVGLAGHHVLHVALRHGARQRDMAERIGPNFAADLYGIAADAIVNETLIQAGHVVPRPCVTLGDLLSRIDDADNDNDNGGDDALADWDADRLALRLHRDPQTAKTARDYGQSRAFALDLAPGEAGTSDEDPDVWSGHMERALGLGRDAGSGIGTVLARLADRAPPRIPWERHLRRLLARALTEAPQPTWRRPSGRWVARHGVARAAADREPAFEPGCARMDHRPRIVIAVDTSSSIDATVLALFAAEIRGIARRSAAETWLLAFDEAVHAERRIGAAGWSDIDALSLRTGGGTDYAPVMERCRALAPSVAVVLTDLDAPQVPAPPCPVIWVAPPSAQKPPYGTLIALQF